MAEQQDAGVDPRFDPVFQRGYDPSTHRRPRAPLPSLAPRAPQPSRPERTEEPVLSAISGVSGVSEAPASEDAPAELARNPFRLLLLLASIAAIAGAAALLWYRLTTDPYYYTTPSSDQGLLFADTFVVALLPALVTAGLLGLVLWLAIGALGNRDRD